MVPSNFTIPQTFSVVFWTLPDSGEGWILFKNSSSPSGISFNIKRISKMFVFDYNSSSTTSESINATANTFLASNL
jgi:hypothetical protein